MHPDPELGAMRAEVDALDRALVDVIAARREAIERIAALKRARGWPAQDPTREAEMLAAMQRYGRERQVPSALLARVLEVVLEDSRARVAAGRPALRIRAATAHDEDTLWLMLTYAASMQPGGTASVAAARRDPALAFYVDGFPRAGELGMIACAEDGRALGAAWLRLAPGHERPPAHKVATATEPELAIAVTPEARGLGVGGTLLGALLAEADARYPATVLSVREGNPSVHLYARLGYVLDGELVNRVGSRSLRMRRPSAAR